VDEFANERLYTVAASQSLLKRAQQVDAIALARPGLFFSGVERIGGYPLFVDRAKGPYIWDVDDNRYIDFVLGFGSVVLGHAHDRVSEAVHAEAMRLGSNPTLYSARQIELAERIVDCCPSVDLVTFMKTGSDATGAAVRLARAITNRRYVLRWGINGWHDWCAPMTAGVVPGSSNFTEILQYNDLEHAEYLFRLHNGDVACVILMPYEVETPRDGYLRCLRELCHQNGALFILDEVRSGFRISLGGAQTHFNVRADLVTYGKALANGHAISVLAGKREYMKHVLGIGMTATYFRMPDAFVAALATLEELEACDGPTRLARLGQKLMDGLDECASRLSVPLKSVGLPSTPFITFHYDLESRRERALRLFCNGMLTKGVLVSPAHHWFICTMMNECDIEHTLSAAAEVICEIRSVI
jgi:glutamate-1-semialdehyde 2,1-aminomutase